MFFILFSREIVIYGKKRNNNWVFVLVVFGFGFLVVFFFFLATQFIRNGIKNNPRQRSEKDGWQLPAP